MGEAQRFYREVVLTDERGPDDPCLIWPYSTNPDGYGQVAVDGRLRLVSRLVCEEIHGAPPAPDDHAAHSCGCGQHGCVTKSHLDWKTRALNEADKVAHGTDNRGERHGMHKLTEPEAREILRLEGKESATSLGRRFGVSEAAVRLIHKRKNWAWLDAA